MKKTLRMILTMVIALTMFAQIFALADTGWVDEGDNRCYYTEENSRLTGWYYEAGNWFCLDSDGWMLKGWAKDDSKDAWYFMNENGILESGWQKILGVWYAFVANTGEETMSDEQADAIPGKWVYVDGETIAYGLQTVGEDEITIENTADRLIGWQEENGKRYFFNEDGEMLTGWNTIADKTYFFFADGSLASGKQYIDGQQIDLGEEVAEPVKISSIEKEPKDNKSTSEHEEQPEKSTEDKENEDDRVITTARVTETETIPFQSETVEDATRFVEDGDVVTQEGVDGEKSVVYLVTYKDGVETRRTKLSETVTKEPVTQIVSKATKEHNAARRENTVEEVIPFETVIVEDNSRFVEDGDVVTQEGVNGVHTIVYIVTYNDGVETSRRVKSDTTVDPVNKIISRATKEHVVETREESSEETVAFETETVLDNSRFVEDGEKVTREGVNGVRTIVYTVTYTDGTETAREVKSDTVTTAPVNKIVSKASKEHVVETKEESKEESVAFETETVPDNTRFVEDGEKVTQEGVNGVRTIVYTVTYTDGTETARTVKSDTITKEPMKKIISKATKEHVNETKEISETSEEPFEVEYVNDATRYESEGEVVTREGVNGVRTKIYSVTYRDGVETSRTLVSDTVTRAPVSKIISRGTKKADTTTKTITVTEDIPYETEEREKPTEETGVRRVAQEGINGKKEVVYTVTYNSAGEEISREKVSETITEQPQKEVIFVGTGTSTYDYEYVAIDLSPWMHGTRSGALDASCQAQAMSMAKSGVVSHSGNGVQGESVGGWGSASAAASGVAAHGGETLQWSTNWGAGCVKVTKHCPDGAIITGYYACAQGSGDIMDH